MPSGTTSAAQQRQHVALTVHAAQPCSWEALHLGTSGGAAPAKAAHFAQPPAVWQHLLHAAHLLRSVAALPTSTSSQQHAKAPPVGSARWDSSAAAPLQGVAPERPAAASEQCPWQALPPLKGSLRGAFRGSACDESLAKQVQVEVDDLAKCVEAFSLLREGRAAALRRAALRSNCQALTARRSAVTRRLAHLATARPGSCAAGGTPQEAEEAAAAEVARLRCELALLEGLCDAEWQRYRTEVKAHAAAHELAQEMQARKAWLEARLAPFSAASVHPALTRTTSCRGLPALAPPSGRDAGPAGQVRARHGASAPCLVLAADEARATSSSASGNATLGGVVRAPSGGGGGGARARGPSREASKAALLAGGGGSTAAVVAAPPHVQALHRPRDGAASEALLEAVAFLRHKGELPSATGCAYYYHPHVGGLGGVSNPRALNTVLALVLAATLAGVCLAVYFS